MTRTSPQSVFAIAQQAMHRGDWETFFECLDRRDLMRLAAMGVDAAGEAARPFTDLCLAHGVPAEMLQRVESLAKDIAESAHAMLHAKAEHPAAAASRSELLERSLRHRDLVKARDKAVADCLKCIEDLAGFAAKAERLKRSLFGGGSVSSTLFVGETLHDVEVDGTKAVALRRMKGGWEEPVAFVQKKGLWHIKLLPGARSSPR